MYEEKIGDSRYTRLEAEDYEEVDGKRINGHGKIVSWTNAEGENHPAYVRTEDGRAWTPEELALAEFDGRHGWIDFDPKSSLA